MTGLQDREAQIRTRISTATDVGNAHHEARPGFCVCLHQWPCSVVLACREALDAASTDLRLVRELPFAETVVLPRILAEDTPPTSRRLSRPLVLRALGARRKRDRR